MQIDEHTQGMKFEIVPSVKANLLRETFIKKFVDTSSGHYRKHIETLRQDADDLFYDGYLRDCLQCNENYQKECSMETAAEFLREKKSIFLMWDLLSKERLSHKRFSLEYPKDTVISVPGDFLSQKVVEEWNREQAAWAADCMCEGLWLPEDIYCFDETMEWYVIFTHEGWEKGWECPNGPELNEDDYIRICFLQQRIGGKL